MHVAKSAIVVVILLTIAAAFLSPDHLLVLCCGALLAAGLMLLWPRRDAPILLLPFGMQWLAVAMKPIESALDGRPLDDFADYGQSLTGAAWFAMAAVAAFGLGLWLVSRRRRVDWAETLARDASNWSVELIVQASLALIVAGSVLALAAPHAGSARQIFVAFAEAKCVGLFVLAYWCLKTGQRLWLLAIVTVIEVVFGLTSYFADFRETFLVLVVAAAASRPRLDLSGVLTLSGVFAAMLAVTVFWTVIKPDYRSFLNQGTHEQVVDRTLSERLSYVGEAADRFDQNQVQIGLQDLAARVSYIDYLALTLKYVPEVRPHEDGRLTKAALTNILEPRILFPDKPPTPNDTDVTNRYTGLYIRANAARGTSISIGYVGELYIDFGYVGGVLGSFLIGAFGGLAYRVLRGFKGIPLFFSYGLATMVLVNFTTFELDLVRFLGSAISLFLAALVLQRLVAPYVLLTLARRDARASSLKASASHALAPFP